MSFAMRSAHAVLFTAFTTLSLASTADIVPSQTFPDSSGLKALPQFPASSTVLQNALNDYNSCIGKVLTGTGGSTTTASAIASVNSQCTAQQAKLKQMLPADAYNKGIADAQQYIAQALASQKSAGVPAQ